MDGGYPYLDSISCLNAWPSFMMGIVFLLRVAIIVHVELLQISWRTLHDSVALCLLKHDDKSKFTNMTHLIIWVPPTHFDLVLHLKLKTTYAY